MEHASGCLAAPDALVTQEIAAPMSSSASHRIPTSVYLYYDCHKILIYVGITQTGIARNRQHNRDKAWWPHVANQIVEHYDSREEAHAREVALISKFRPPFNQQHNPDHQQLRAAYTAAMAVGAFGTTAEHMLIAERRRTITLEPSVDDIGRILFTTDPTERAMALGLRFSQNVGVYDIGNRHLGLVTAINVGTLKARISTNVPESKLYLCGQAHGRLRFITNKEPFVLELKRISLSL